MNIPRVDMGISMGNILTIITMIVGLSVGYEATVGNVTANTKNIYENSQRINKISDRVTTLIDALQSERISQTQLLTEMKVDLRYLRQTVDEIRKSGQ